MNRQVLCLLVMSLALFGCEAPLFNLPGHSERNCYNPPPVSMRVGESLPVISRGGIPGTSPGVISYPRVVSMNTNIVVVDHNENFTHSRIRAVAPGSTRVFYNRRILPGKDSGRETNNRGFEVTVR